MLREEIQTLSAETHQLRSFGVTLGMALLMIAGVLYWRDISGSTVVAWIGSLIFVAGLIAPEFLRPLYKPWMTLALVLGFLMTRVLLTGIFVGLFLPIGLLMRLFGRDPLRRKWKADVQTYWISKRYDGKISERLERYY